MDSLQLGLKILFITFIFKTVSAQTEVCKDVYIWAFDGSVDCEYLKKPTAFGVHKDPEYWCEVYPLTDCCATCAELKALPDYGRIIVVEPPPIKRRRPRRYRDSD